MADQAFEAYGQLVKSLGMKFYGKYADMEEVPWDGIEEYVIERYGERFLDLAECLKMTAFAIFHMRAVDAEWYRVLMLDEAFQPLTASGVSPAPVESPQEIVPLIVTANVSPDHIRRMALQGLTFSIWLATDQIRQAFATCEGDKEEAELWDMVQRELEADPEFAAWE
jgi:hypothetical protein